MSGPRCHSFLGLLFSLLTKLNGQLCSPFPPVFVPRSKRALSQEQEGLQVSHVQSLWKAPNERASFSPDLPRAKQAGEIKGLERVRLERCQPLPTLCGLDLLLPLPRPPSVQWDNNLLSIKTVKTGLRTSAGRKEETFCNKLGKMLSWS